MLVAILMLFLFRTGFTNEGREYINSWIVQIDGDAEEAESLARKHGFNNEGLVCYDFVLINRARGLYGGRCTDRGASPRSLNVNSREHSRFCFLKVQNVF